jgi:hypothetical protein
MTRAFWGYLICWGPLDQSCLGSCHSTTQARAMLQLALRVLQYVLQYMVKKIISYKQLILVFLLHFSVALAQNTTGVTTITTMAAAGGNVGTLNDGYVRRVTLPRAPRIQSSEHVTCNVTAPCDDIYTCYLEQVPLIPTWHDLARLLASISRTMILPIMPVWFM